MKFWKKLTAVAMSVALALSLTACIGNGYSKVLTVEGEDIAPGLYLMMQLRAYSEAEGLVENEDKDVLKQRIEGQSASKWIQNRTIEMAQRYVAVRNLSREYGVTLSDESWSGIESSAEYWDYLADYYLENGVGYDSWMYQIENSYLDEELFYYLYDEGGEFYPGKAAMKEAYAEQRTHVRYLSLPITWAAANENEPTLTDEEIEEKVSAQAEDMLKRLNSGEVTLEELADTDFRDIYDLTGRTFDYEDPSEYVYSLYVNPESETYEEDVQEHFANGAVGEYGISVGGTSIMLYEIIPMFENDEQFEEQKAQIMSLIYYEEYEEYLKSIYSEYSVSKSFLATWYYRPSKIV